MDNIPSLELQTFTDEPIAKFEVKLWRPTLLQRVMRKPLSRTFTIYRTRVCNMGRAAAIANRIILEGNISDLGSLIEVTMPLIHSHRKDVIRLIACCIQNNSKEPSNSLMTYLDDNMSADMMNDILSICLLNLGLQSFLSAIILIKGTSANFASDMDAEAATELE